MLRAFPYSGSRVLVAIALACIAVQTASAHVVQYSTILSGPNESPPNASPGTGTVLVTFDLDVVTMRVEASFAGLLGTTTMAHIHGLTASPNTGTANVATQLPSFPGFPLGVTAGIFDQTYDMTLASSYNPAFITASGGTVSDALNALILGLDTGRTYFNIHTSQFGAGEIRGFLNEVPEPSSLGLLVVGSLFALRRRSA